MAAKRKTARKRPSSRATAKGRSLDLTQELPARLSDFTKQIRSHLRSLEKDIVKAQTSYRRVAARLLREASVELGKFETRGEREWKKLSQGAGRKALSMLRRLENLVGSSKSKGGGRGKGATKVARRATQGAQRALRQAASQVAPAKRKKRRS